MAMSPNTYKVVKGDTLSEIAQKYRSAYNSSNGTSLTTYQYVTKLVDINDLDNANFISIGQVLKLEGSATAKKKNTSSKPIIKNFGVQANTDRTLFATWTWDKSHTDNYKTMWYYATGDGVWFVGSDGTTEYKQATYSAPANATKVKFKVKAVATKHTVNKKEAAWWTGNWSTEKTHQFAGISTTPSAPSVEIKDYKLTASLDNININATYIEFAVYKYANGKKSKYTSKKAAINTKYASYTFTVPAGAEYSVQCRAVKGSNTSEWSDFSSTVGTPPPASKGILPIKALSETSIQIDWENVSTATEYEIQYTTKTMYFDSSSSEVTSVTVDGTVVGHAEITGMESGQEYFFRVRCKNTYGESGWTAIKSIKIGEKPGAPTTWSSTTTVIVGEPLNLYWIHNSVDGSSQTYAELELTIGETTTTQTIKNSTDKDEKDKTSVYSVNTSSYPEGTKILWRVRTMGIINTYGEWSVQRTVDVYAQPTVDLSIKNSDGDVLEVIESFPFFISALAGPNTQAPIGYHVEIVANEGYETADYVGNVKMVNVGEVVYSNYFDTSDALLAMFSAGNIDLENNISYTVTVTAAMNSGLTGVASTEFTVSWMDIEYEPNAEIIIDEDSYSASIRPYCEDEDGNLMEGVTLSVYRREFDGSFTEIASGVDHTKYTYVSDPHPALDYARYRIVAIAEDTGSVSYCDLVGVPVGCHSIIIQWDEEWTSFDTTEESELEQPPWTGSLLKLPYNIDISDKTSPDVTLVKYIGRKRPVAYYGTQLGESSSWSAVIEKADEEALYAIHRLAVWMGNVYVREPSGTGYWANVKVSNSINHKDLTIPISLDVTRVEGGM